MTSPAPDTGPTRRRWDDLGPRTVSGIVMAVIALVAILAGSVWFQIMAVFCAAVMIWELWMMIRPEKPDLAMMMAALSAAALSGHMVSDGLASVLVLCLVPVLGAALIGRERPGFLGFAFGIQIAAVGLISLRLDFGIGWTLWVIGVVVATDIAGYFAGKRIGGPKFWPRISPRKTWAGTGAGWAAAAILGVIAAIAISSFWPLPLAIALSFASQMGDIAESALKRRMGVKDSSDLIPGHGGLFDRFDGILGATLLLLLLTKIAGFSLVTVG